MVLEAFPKNGGGGSLICRKAYGGISICGFPQFFFLQGTYREEALGGEKRGRHNPEGGKTENGGCPSKIISPRGGPFGEITFGGGWS